MLTILKVISTLARAHVRTKPLAIGYLLCLSVIGLGASDASVSQEAFTVPAYSNGDTWLLRVRDHAGEDHFVWPSLTGQTIFETSELFLEEGKFNEVTFEDGSTLPINGVQLLPPGRSVNNPLNDEVPIVGILGFWFWDENAIGFDREASTITVFPGGDVAESDLREFFKGNEYVSQSLKESAWGKSIVEVDVEGAIYDLRVSFTNQVISLAKGTFERLSEGSTTLMVDFPIVPLSVNNDAAAADLVFAVPYDAAESATLVETDGSISVFAFNNPRVVYDPKGGYIHFEKTSKVKARLKLLSSVVAMPLVVESETLLVTDVAPWLSKQLPISDFQLLDIGTYRSEDILRVLRGSTSEFRSLLSEIVQERVLGGRFRFATADGRVIVGRNSTRPFRVWGREVTD